MLTFVEAIKEIESRFRGKPKTKKVALVKGVNHIIAEEVYCKEDLPPLPKSTMDGFVVSSRRKNYEIKGEITLLSNPPTHIKDDEAYQVYTGSLLPYNSLYVIKKELATVNGRVLFVKSESAFEKNFLDAGEDCKRGEPILKKGDVLSSRAASFIGLAGIKNVKVYKKPKVAILPIGTELIGKSGPDLTGFAIKGIARSMMVNAELIDPVPDSVDDISKTVKLLSKKHDVLLTVGGTGVSIRDLTENALLLSGGNAVFKGIKLQPGRTSGFFIFGKKPIINLPGNAQAAVAAFFALFPKALQAMGFMPYVKKIRAILKQKLDVEEDWAKVFFIRLENSNGCIIADPINIKPHTLKFLLDADALLITNKPLSEGSMVEIMLI